MVHNLKEKTLTLIKELHPYQIEEIIYRFLRRAVQEIIVRRNLTKNKII